MPQRSTGPSFEGMDLFPVSEAAPSPPVEHVLNTGGQLTMTIGTSIVAVGFYVFAVRMARRERSPWPVIVMLGSALCMLLEPVYDANFHVWFYDRGEIWGLYSAYGMTQPIWVPITYLWVYGGLALLVCRHLIRGGSRRDMGRLIVVVFTVFSLFELIGINLDTYEYYGPHPFRVMGFPLWLSVMNTTVSITAGVAVYRLLPVVRGAERWLLLVVVPASFAMMEFLAFPALVVINTDDPPMWLVYAAVLLAVAISCAAQRLVLKAVPEHRRAPADPAELTERSTSV
jgi:hypothetical protein